MYSSGIAFGIIRALQRMLRCITRTCRCNVCFRSSAYRSENGITCARMTPVFLKLC